MTCPATPAAAAAAASSYPILMRADAVHTGHGQGSERPADRTRHNGGQRDQRLRAGVGRQGVPDQTSDTRQAREEVLPVSAREDVPGQRLPEVQLRVPLLRAVHVPRLRLRAQLHSFPIRDRYGVVCDAHVSDPPIESR